MNFIYLSIFALILFLGIAYRRRQVRKQIEQASMPNIPEALMSKEAVDDATCLLGIEPFSRAAALRLWRNDTFKRQ